jgi:hypothetical protein
MSEAAFIARRALKPLTGIISGIWVAVLGMVALMLAFAAVGWVVEYATGLQAPVQNGPRIEFPGDQQVLTGIFTIMCVALVYCLCGVAVMSKRVIEDWFLGERVKYQMHLEREMESRKLKPVEELLDEVSRNV